MSVLEQLIHKLGSVELDARGLEVEIDGRPVTANSVIKIAVAAAKDAPPASAQQQSVDDDEEWEWKIALARARARAEEALIPKPKPSPTLPRSLARDIQSRRARTLRDRLGRRRLAQGTAPPMPSDDDVTRPIDIRPLPGTPPVKREPPPLPPPPED